jgi:predicted Zn-dependent protease
MLTFKALFRYLVEGCTAAIFVIAVMLGSASVTPMLWFVGRVQAQTPAPVASPALRAMVNRLLQSNQLPTTKVAQALLQPSNSLNAYTDGQKIVVTTGLWNALKTDDERAFVVSHELAHITLSHVPKSVVRQVGFGVFGRLVQVWTGNPVAGQLSNVGLDLANRKFGRGDEYQADELGLRYMQKAGYNTQAAKRVFEVLNAASPNNTPEFLRTHPTSANRVQRILGQNWD